ncbi:MAG: ABC transporter ATP-binding protein [Ignavibacteria bacterium CG_4_9_14_3_um_filter_36_18]|nr:ABC transporter ATP-binding protein [Ignavibacteria bacterium]PJA99316.1 MAG: ABC transporter ATP-binding protein [Ignavibacteria bacterium CG_4_9_14_3_um_filter_36_18]
MNNDTILNIDSIRKSFVRNIINVRGEGEDEKSYILNDIDLLVPKGKVTALIGGNGAGKTTLFNIISGFIKADEGKISFQPNGSLLEITEVSACKIARLGVGRMFQDNHIFQNMTVLENMLIADDNFFGERPFESIFFYKKDKVVEKQRIEKAEKIFTDLFGVENPFLKMKNEKAKNLSYGQKRLLGLARLLMGDYKLLLLDEPTSGVNPIVVEKIKEIIKYFVEEKELTIFLIEHNMKFVLDVSDFCHFMSKGIIATGGTPEDIIGNPEVRKTYLGI